MYDYIKYNWRSFFNCPLPRKKSQLIECQYQNAPFSARASTSVTTCVHARADRIQTYKEDRGEEKPGSISDQFPATCR